MNETELAYIAGIIDGEGYLGISCTKTSIGNNCYYPRLTVHMLDRESIDLMCAVFKIKMRNSILNQKSYFSFYANGKNLKTILLLIYKYLRVKKKHADLLLKLIESKEKNKPKPIFKDGHFRGTESVPINIIKEREQLFNKFKKLQLRYEKRKI